MNEPIILLVEDDPIVRFLGLKQFTKLGINCDSAVNGLEAVAKTLENAYNIIFMDLSMPLLDGIDATIQIRKHEERRGIPRTPIVAMTAYMEKQQCFEAGMDDFLFKPVRLEELQQMLHKWKVMNGAQ